MNRRQVLLRVSASVLAVGGPNAFAQSNQAWMDDLNRVASNPRELEDILVALDALWVIIALAYGQRERPMPLSEARQSYLRFRLQIAVPRAPQVVASLQASDTQRRLAELSRSLEPVSARLRGLLRETGLREGPVLDAFVRAFNTATRLLSALSPANDAWYCQVYGLQLLCR
jgi:hypothetical protein